MARPLVLPNDFMEHDFLAAMRIEPNARTRIRLLALYHVQAGESLVKVAKIVKFHWQTIQSWVSRFCRHGFPGISDLPRSGAPQKIEGKAECWLAETMQALSESQEGGYITGRELQDILDLFPNKHMCFNYCMFLG